MVGVCSKGDCLLISRSRVQTPTSARTTLGLQAVQANSGQGDSTSDLDPYNAAFHWAGSQHPSCTGATCSNPLQVTITTQSTITMLCTGIRTYTCMFHCFGDRPRAQTKLCPCTIQATVTHKCCFTTQCKALRLRVHDAQAWPLLLACP